MITRLIDTLKNVGKPAEVFKNPDGSRVLLLPYGGRILGLFAPGSDENFFWTNPALQSAAAAREFYASGEWHNSGGDRTWLAPEVDVFFPEYPDLNTYWQPRRLDPGEYRLESGGEGGGEIRMVNRLRLTFSRSKKELGVCITKSVAPAANPLRYESIASEISHTQYAGYTLKTSLALDGANADDSEAVGLWNLVQMPHGGELFIPTHARTAPKTCFGDIPGGDLIVGDRLIRYRMRAAGGQKLSVRAVAATGRAGYLYAAADGRRSLIVRNFFVNPSGEYVDVPWSDAGDLGYSTQACNINNDMGSFSELEYHAPAAGRGTGQNRCDDVSAVWAFRGPREEINLIGKTLLTADFDGNMQ